MLDYVFFLVAIWLLMHDVDFSLLGLLFNYECNKITMFINL